MRDFRVAHIGWLASYHLRRRVRALARRGCAHVVYTDHLPDHIVPAELGCAVEVLPQELIACPRALLEWFNRSLAEYGIDIVHGHSTHFPASLGMFCSNVVRVNSIWDFVYSKDPQSPLHYRATLESLERGRLAEAVSFSSPVVRRQWLDRGYPADRALLHSWGVDLNVFGLTNGEGVDRLRKDLGLKPEERVILSSRTTSLTANLDILIKAAMALRSSLPVRLVVLGGTVTREVRYLERLLAEPGVKDAVVFAGSVLNDAELRVYYEMADVVASVHSNDHNPATVLESMVMERPVVVCGIPSVNYWARDGETGFSVPHRDLEATIGALRRSLDLSASERAEMGRCGRELVLREADFSHALDVAARDYRTLSALPKAPVPGEYESGLWLDMRGRMQQSADHYERAVKQGVDAPLLGELLDEKRAASGTRDHEYFSKRRAQPGVVRMVASPREEWPRLARDLPPPVTLFRHDYIAGVQPLLESDPPACLHLLGTMADRFEDDLMVWVAESVQWFGGTLGLWEPCARLLACIDGDGGTTLAVHALGCARVLGHGHELFEPLLAKSIAWSHASITHIGPELDVQFRENVQAEAELLLADMVSAPIIDWRRVYGTTDRPWAHLSQVSPGTRSLPEGE